MNVTIKKIIFCSSIFISLFIAVLSSFGYGEAFIKYLGLPFYIFIFLALVPAFILRFIKKNTQLLSNKLFFIHLIFFIVLLLISVISVLTEFLVYSNFFYAQFHLDPYALYYLPLLLYILFFFYKSYKQHWRILIFFVPILLILLAFLIRAKGYGIFANYFANEDSWIEYTQFIFYLVSSYLSFRIGFILKKRQLILFWIFITIAFSFFMIAGEEISWGQRIFNISTPENLAERNTQGELNIHNHELIFGYVYRLYLTVSGYAATAWIVKLLILDRFFKNWQRTYSLFIPNWQWASAFIFSFVIFYLHRIRNQNWLQIFEEFNELIFSWGLLAFFAENYFREKKY